MTNRSSSKSAKVAETGRRPLTVGDLVHAGMVSTSPDSPVAEVAAAMVREKVGSALVMQGPFLAGILTERDVLKAAASGSDLTTLPVSAWMTKDPQSATPETPVEDAAQIMLLNGFRHLPVVAGRRVYGVVSLRDLFAARISRPPQQRGVIG
jgi:CBS domain-containing protein